MHSERGLQEGSVWESSKGLSGPLCCGRQHLRDAGGSAGCGLEPWSGGGLEEHELEKVCGLSHVNILLLVIKSGSIV